MDPAPPRPPPNQLGSLQLLFGIIQGELSQCGAAEERRGGEAGPGVGVVGIDLPDHIGIAAGDGA